MFKHSSEKRDFCNLNEIFRCIITRYSGNIEEDSMAIRISMLYTKESLADIYHIFKQISNLGLEPVLEIFYEKGCVKEKIVHNFEIILEARDRIANSRRFRSRRDEIVRMDADISFLNGQRRIEGIICFIDFLSNLTGYTFLIFLNLEKRKISEYILSKCNFYNITVHPWIFKKNFEIYLSSDPADKSYDILWNEKFPVIVILDLKYSFTTNFSLIHNNTELDMRGFESKIELRDSFKKISSRLCEYIEGKKILIHLALLTEDTQFKKIIQEIFKINLYLDDVSKLPFDETQYLEFKLNWQDYVDKICSFANACGGLMMIGIDDKTKELKGVSQGNIDKIYDSINKIIPPPACEIWPLPIDQNKVIYFIFIRKAKDRTVYKLPKGERPFRSGSSTIWKMDDEEVLQLRRQICD